MIIIVAALCAAGCAGVTSQTAQKVALFDDESTMPEQCEQLGEVTVSVCANTTPCPAEVMKKELREAAYIEYGADAVLHTSTMLSGTDVVGYGIAYKCN